MPYCLGCGSMIDEWDSGYYARNMFCIPCYVRKTSEIPMVSCARCGVRVKQDESRRESGNAYCSYCASELERIERTPVCPLCKKTVESWQKSVVAPDGRTVHVPCMESYARKKTPAHCIRCGKETDIYNVTREGLVVCYACARREPEAGKGGPLLARVLNRIGSMINK